MLTCITVYHSNISVKQFEVTDMKFCIFKGSKFFNAFLKYNSWVKMLRKQIPEYGVLFYYADHKVQE